MSDKKQTLVKNTFIIAFGSLSVQLVSFLLLPLYTAYLSAKDYGVIDIVSTYSTLLGPIITLQIGMASFRFLVDARGNQRETSRLVTNVLAFTALLLVGFTVLYIAFLQFVPLTYAVLVALTIGTGAVSALFMQFARGLDKIKHFAIAGFVAGLSAIALNVAAIVIFDMGASGILLAGAIGNVICAAYVFFVLKIYRYIRPSLADKSLLSELLKYSLPLIPNSASWWVINAADRTIIATFLGLTSNGIYAIAYKFPIVFTTIFSFFNMSWTESASVHINAKDRDSFFSEVGNSSVRFFGSLAAIMLAGVSIIFPIFINSKFHDAYVYIPILMAASYFSSMVAVYGAVYIAKKKTKQIANTSIIAAIINIVLSLALIKFIGMYATALAAVVAYLSMTIFRHYDSKKYAVITYQHHILLKMVLLYAFTCALYYYNNLVLNFVNAAVTCGFAIILNRSFIPIIKQKVFGKLRRLTPDQEVAEMTEIHD